MTQFIRLFAFAVLVFLGVQSHAATQADFTGFHPAQCPCDKKAANALDPQVSFDEDGVMRVSFNLWLLECKPGAHQFSTYEPVKNEYVELYDIHSSETRPAKAPIAFYEAGKKFSAMNLEMPYAKLQWVPAADGTSKLEMRMDVYVYGARISFKLTVKQTGEASVSRAP